MKKSNLHIHHTYLITMKKINLVPAVEVWEEKMTPQEFQMMIRRNWRRVFFQIDKKKIFKIFAFPRCFTMTVEIYLNPPPTNPAVVVLRYEKVMNSNNNNNNDDYYIHISRGWYCNQWQPGKTNWKFSCSKNPGFQKNYESKLSSLSKKNTEMKKNV